MPVKSYVNQPDRIFLNSSDDITTPYNGQFNTFQANFITPIMNAERCQLLRATIPTPGPALPDYALEFWYAKKDTENELLSGGSVKCIRILPYGFVPTSPSVDYAINRYITSYSDFIDLLNQASNNDDVAYNPYWAGAGDLEFSLDISSNKIRIKGDDNTKYYQVIGYGSVWQEAQSPNILLPPGNKIVPTAEYYLVKEYNLNLRVGFALPTAYTGWDNSIYDASLYPNSNSGAPSMTTVLGGVYITADSYPNLVRTQCIYLYSNIAVASAMGSNNRHNLLCVIPVNSPALGVSNYTALTINFLTKVANDSIQNINIEMLDDANQPYILPDNAQVNLEIAFKYCD